MTKANVNDRTVALRNTVTSAVRKCEGAITAMNIQPALYERVAFNALTRGGPSLQRCTTDSIHVALLQCAEMGLFPDGNEAALVPYKNKATLIPMVAGLLRLAREALPGLSIWSAVVYTGDEFDFAIGTEPHITHRPSAEVSHVQENIAAVYACARVAGAKEVETEVLFIDEILRYREMSAAGRRNDGPWATHFGEMARKTALRRLLKRLPRRGGMALALQADEEAETEMQYADVVDVEAVETPEAVKEAAAKATSPSTTPAPKPKERKGKAKKQAAPAPEPAPAPAQEPEPDFVDAELVEEDEEEVRL